MSNTRILDLVESIFASNYEEDSEIDTDDIEELLFALEVELRVRDGE